MKKREYLQRKSLRVTAMALAILMSVSIFAQTLPKYSAEDGVSGSDIAAAAEAEEVVTVEIPAEVTEGEEQISETVSLEPVEEETTEKAPVEEAPAGEVTLEMLENGLPEQVEAPVEEKMTEEAPAEKAADNGLTAEELEALHDGNYDRFMGSAAKIPAAAELDVASFDNRKLLVADKAYEKLTDEQKALEDVAAAYANMEAVRALLEGTPEPEMPVMALAVGGTFYTKQDFTQIAQARSVLQFTVTSEAPATVSIAKADSSYKPSSALNIPSSVEYDGVTYSVTSFGDDAFKGCTGLTSVTIPSSVTSIGENAFNGCYGLKSVTIPSSVTSIGENAFNGCSDLTSVTIPSSVTSIGENAFFYCSGLTSVTIEGSQVSIAFNAFNAVGNINVPVTLVIRSDLPDAPTGDNPVGWKYGNFNVDFIRPVKIDSNITNGTVTASPATVKDSAEARTVTLTVTPDSGYELDKLYYIAKSAPTDEISIVSSSFSMPKDDVTVYATFKHVRDGSEEYPWLIGKNDPADVKAYFDKDTKTLTIEGTGATMDWTGDLRPEWSSSGVQHLVVNSGVTALGKMIFWNSNSILTANLGGVTEIGDMAFYCARKLESVTANSLVTAKINAFSSCGLKSIDFPNLTTAGNSAFNNNIYLKSASLPKLAVISDHCFDGCSALEAYDFSNVTSIKESGFGNCSNLAKIDIPGNTVLGDSAFIFCSRVKSVSIPNVTSLGGQAFFSVGAMSPSGKFSVTLSPDLTEIPSMCFCGMTNMNKMIFTSESMPTIGNAAFNNVTADIYFPVTWLSDALKLEDLNKTGGLYQYNGKLTYHACYTVNTAETANGSVSSDKALAESGETVTVTVTPATGYVLDKLTYKAGTADPVDIKLNEGKYTFAMPENDVTVTATFKVKPDGSKEHPWLIGKNKPSDVTAYFDSTTKTLTIEGTGATKDWTSSAKPEWSVCDVQHLVVKSGVTALGAMMFWANSAITTADLGGVTELGNMAFFSAANLKSVTANSLETVGPSAFSSCKLESVNFPKLTTAGASMFNDNTDLKSASLPKLAVIPDNCFASCSALEAYDFTNVTSIGQNAFNSCKALTDINIPGKTAIGSKAFAMCKGVESLNIPNVTSLGESAFNNAGPNFGVGVSKYYSVTLSPELTNIPKSCFDCMWGLNKIVYTSESMPNIGQYAFFNLTADVYIPASWLSDTLTIDMLNDTSGDYQYSAKKLTYHAYYTVNTEETANGSVSSDKALAESGETVELEATPATGFEFIEWQVTDKGGNPVEVKDNKFTMPASDVTVSAVFKKPQTITAPASITVTYGTPVSIEASTDGDGALSYVSNKTASCTVDSTGKVTFAAADSSADNYVTVKAAATDTCSAAEVKVAVKTVKASATFGFDPADTVTAYSGETAAQVNARVNAKLTGLATGDVTTDYGTPYVEVLNKDGHTQVSGDEVLLASKEYISSAEIDNDGAKKDCYDVDKTMIQRALPVVLREQKIAADNVTVKLVATGKSVSGTVSEKAVEGVAALTGKFGTLSYVVTDGTDVISIDASSGAITINKRGQATVTITAAANDYYKKATKNVTVTVTEKDIQTVTASAPAKLYVGDKTQKVKASTNGDGKLTYTATPADVVSVAADGTISALKAGEATITVTAAETADYAADDENITVTVAKRTQQVTADDLTIADTDSGIKLEPTVSEVAVSGVPALLGKTAKPVYKSSDESIATVDENGVVTVKKPGKVKISMTLPGNEYYDEVTVSAEFTLTVAPLSVIEGEGGKYKVGSKEGLTFRSNGVYDHFVGVKVDDKDVTAKNYTSWEGSTYVKFTTKYLDSLTTGKHKLTYVFTNGKCSAYFYVERPSGGSQKGNPDTGDEANIVLWVNLLLVSVMTVALIVIDRKKRGLSINK